MANILRRAVALAAVGTVLATTAACGGGESSDSGSSDDALTIGFVDNNYSQLFSQQQRPAIQKALEGRGWTVTFVDSGGSPAKAVAAMQNFVQKKVDVIVTQTYASDQLAAGLAAAEAAGIPVVSTAAGELGDGMAGGIVYVGAEPINEATIASVEGDTPVEMLQLGYTPGAPCRARSEDLNDRLADHPNVTVTKAELKFPGADKTAQDATAGWLQSHPDSDGAKKFIWLCTSDGLAGVLAAQAQLKRGPYELYTWDLSAPAAQAVKDGTLTGVLYLPADKSSEQLADLIEEVVNAGDDWEPKAVPAESVIVTKDNIAEFEGAQ